MYSGHDALTRSRVAVDIVDSAVLLESGVDRVELFRLTLRFFDGVVIFFSIPTSNFSTTRWNFQYVVFVFSSKVDVNFCFNQFSIGTMAIIRSSTVFLS